jgi:cullin 3
MDSGLVSMITNKKADDLKRVYLILQRIPAGIPELKTQLSNHVRTLARNINNTISDPHNKRPGSASSISENGNQESSQSKSSQTKVDHIAWVQSMLSLKSEYDQIVAECFQQDQSIEVEVYNTLEAIINENLRSAEFISLFLDENLKKGLKGKSDEEVESLLDQAIVLFRFLREKDIFDRYYKQHLAKRLLLGRSVGEDAERSMISKLKVNLTFTFEV